MSSFIPHASCEKIMIISKTTNALSLRKRILFICTTIILVWGSVEAILHASTYLRLLPYVPTITPSFYTRETVKFKVDKNGSPIFVDGYKVYRQPAIFPKPREIDLFGLKYYERMYEFIQD